MKLYLVEAPVNDGEFRYWARTWAASQSGAAAVRASYTSNLGVARKDIQTTAIHIDTRKEGLLELLNSMANMHDGYLGEKLDG